MSGVKNGSTCTYLSLFTITTAITGIMMDAIERIKDSTIRSLFDI